jgi:zinc transporter ZupT
MNLLTQLTVLAVFLGLAVYLARGLPKRVILVANAFAAGSILFLIISTISVVITRIAELSQANRATVGFLSNPWVFAAITLFAIFVVPMIMIFTVGERRRSVIIAVALGLFNLGFGLTAGSDTVSGILGITIGVGALLALIFLLEGVAIGALLMKARPTPWFVIGLGATAVLPALVGFNLNSVSSLDIFVPLIYAAAAGFMLFYLPFILGMTNGGNSNDIKWHFIGILTGLFVTGLVITAFSLLGR